ncbi:YbjQ family protein [Geothrix sp. 21YS21S-4]|uniref:YbjQ family protein n=1 Tax=Geothrix sp. 21YS21S-4 TaxID=3068889 RepID=UPI0027B8CBFD|nr:YbjQ family protein [Geothrix sp. 21YS21S-4]
MLASTTFTIDGYDILDTKGLVRGIIVRSPTISQGILGGLKNIIGGKIGAYTTMCEQTRSQAYEDMVEHAKALGANAIVGVRYDASSVEPRGGAVEVLCYGTAVVVTKQAR